MKLKDRLLLFKMIDKCRVNTVKYNSKLDVYCITYLDNKDKKQKIQVKGGDLE